VPFIIPENFTIRGKVVVEMNCVSPGKNVTLHFADMELHKSSIVLKEGESGKKVPIAEHVFDSDREFYIAQLNEGLTVGKSYSIQVKKNQLMQSKMVYSEASINS
jgi:hypothetical protein